jgi:hypothetical protein
MVDLIVISSELGMSRETLRQLRLRGVHPGPAGAGGICSTENHKPDVESCLYGWPGTAQGVP